MLVFPVPGRWRAEGQEPKVILSLDYVRGGFKKTNTQLASLMISVKCLKQLLSDFQ